MAIVRNKIFGRGLSFPLQVSPDGGFKKDIDSSHIVESGINIILLHRLTRDLDTNNLVGERVWRPQFGSQVGIFKFEPNTPETYVRVERAITSPIRKFEPRIKDLTLKILPSPRNPAVAFVFLSYKLISTNEVGNLVYPLYLSI